jgi:hypothetical protein
MFSRARAAFDCFVGKLKVETLFDRLFVRINKKPLRVLACIVFRNGQRSASSWHSVRVHDDTILGYSGPWQIKRSREGSTLPLPGVDKTRRVTSAGASHTSFPGRTDSESLSTS